MTCPYCGAQQQSKSIYCDNSSNTTASPASTARIVLQTGDCQQVRRTGRFLQGGGGGQDEQRFGCIVIMPLSHRWNS